MSERAECVGCVPDDADHCHGTLVRHADGRVECIEPGCPPERGRHEFVVECGAETPGCCT